MPGFRMPDSRTSVEGLSTITSIAQGRKDSRRVASAVTQSPERDLLLYMGAMLAEIEAMAVAADFESLADMLGCSRREVNRRVDDI
jgi:hypothetical protein